MASARLTFENDGVVPLMLILDDRNLESLAPWVDPQELRGQRFLLGPQEQLSVEVPLVGEALQPRAELELSRDNFQSHESTLSFLTSASVQPLELTLLLTFEPWVQPAASVYRFLPIERLRDGVLHEVAIYNAAATTAELVDIVIDEDPIAPPEGYERILGKSLLRCDVSLPFLLQQGEAWTHELLLEAGELELPGDKLGWFSATVRYDLLIDSEPRQTATRLSGVVGRGPTLEGVGATGFTTESPDLSTHHTLAFRNSGQLPVEVLAVEILREAGEPNLPAPDPDWLVVEGLEVGDLIEPGEERTFSVAFDRRARPWDEFQQEFSRRTLLIRHDGWHEPAARHLRYEVSAGFGLADPGTIGIDFGTSNSLACWMGAEQGYPLILETFEDGRAPSQQLPSLMYFDGDGDSYGDGDGERFLYGDMARGAARNQPANLVRSIKTVVMDGRKSEYFFLKKVTGGGLRHVRQMPQELLTLFIQQIRVRAEAGAGLLSSEVLDREGITGRRQVFSTAVFSHPVEIPEAMKEALMQAAQRAGINADLKTAEEFVAEHCVDEATAAVLAYVYQLLLDDQENYLERPLKDLENILCVDIGGGTTDIAAVRVRDLASYASGAVNQVTVELHNRAGDPRFAGDVLDRLLAKEMLNEIERQSREQGAVILTDEVEFALRAPSFTVYQNGSKDRLRSDPSRRNGPNVDPYDVYGLAGNLLDAAESAKRTFSLEAQFTKGFTGTGWPREREAEAAATENFEVVLERDVFEEIVRRELGGRLWRLDSAVAGAGWDWSLVTTLLLTGQSMRSPIIRRPIIEHVKERMGEAALEVVEPGDDSETENRFDPKACVAIGAAIWGMSRTQDDAWLVIRNLVLERLTFDLTTKGGPRFTTVDGLYAGIPLPAVAKLPPFPGPRTELVLYRDREKYVRFVFPLPTSEVAVRVESPSDLYAEIDGKSYRGEIFK